MIGQIKLLKALNTYTLATLPQTVLFLGESGSGRHTVVNYLATKFGLDIINITAETTAEQLTEYQFCPLKKIYLINLDNITQKQQNQFLKFIEEPSETNYIMLIATAEVVTLPTILSRCIKFHMDPYTEDELKHIQIYNNNLLYKVCTTPGQVLAVDLRQLESMHNLASTVVLKINQASYENTLSIATKINFKDQYDKFDFDIFLKMIIYVAYQSYIENNNNQALIIYKITNNYYQLSQNKLILRENLMLSYLTELWKQCQNESDVSV